MRALAGHVECREPALGVLLANNGRTARYCTAAGGDLVVPTSSEAASLSELMTRHHFTSVGGEDMAIGNIRLGLVDLLQRLGIR